MTTLYYLPSDKGFLGADAAVPSQEARCVVVPFGMEATVTYGTGTRRGPDAILEASRLVELFDDEYWCEPYRQFGIATLKTPPVASGVRAAVDQIARITGEIEKQGRFPLVLGGEHTLTVGAVQPHAASHKGLVVLHIDAHADLRPTYGGEPYSHACAMARVLDDPGISLVSVGVRAMSPADAEYLELNPDRVHVHWARDRSRWDPADIVAPLKGRPIYVTVDVDGFDSSLMPATGTPEPGGLMFDDVLAVLRAAAGVGTIVGADIVELAPIDGLHACDFLAAKLAYKLLTYALAEPGGA